jgi:hypothetical protein
MSLALEFVVIFVGSFNFRGQEERPVGLSRPSKVGQFGVGS